MPQRTILISRIYTIWGIVLIIWALYRAFIVQPEFIDELVVKPLVFLGPVIFFVFFLEKRPLASIGITKNKFKRDFYLGLGFAIIFTLLGLTANFAKYGSLSLSPKVSVTQIGLLTALFLSLFTSFTEELFIRGFLFSRLKEGYQNEFKAMIVSSLMYLLILIPVIFTRLHLTGITLFVFVTTNLVLSVANAMIFSETKTITLPVFIHAFWNLAVMMYL